jgi:hypothetical protein
MISRDEMLAELKRTVVPVLRELGFRGSMPHLHRVGDDGHVDLLTVQFSGGGGSFVVELGFADAERQNVYVGKDTPAPRLRVSQTLGRRRLGAVDGSSDFWFVYEGERPGMSGDPSTLAETVGELINSQAVPWWSSKRATGL